MDEAIGFIKIGFIKKRSSFVGTIEDRTIQLMSFIKINGVVHMQLLDNVR
ncbi:hypothetical protein ACFPTR_05855 [Aliibacillus thermotolerans]|uniref:Uncharacterized protein n=1 Tax=Aliibacillus thermotolerans TaxID=1834418 RepID=A0ABW0U716_9BACI|nr:hypothetical protein [Aliibacillus thermotolerans]